MEIGDEWWEDLEPGAALTMPSQQEVAEVRAKNAVIEHAYYPGSR
jgi:hypothetical protein